MATTSKYFQSTNPALLIARKQIAKERKEAEAYFSNQTTNKCNFNSQPPAFIKMGTVRLRKTAA
jgi:hypothetical protein